MKQDCLVMHFDCLSCFKLMWDFALSCCKSTLLTFKSDLAQRSHALSFESKRIIGFKQYDFLFWFKTLCHHFFCKVSYLKAFKFCQGGTTHLIIFCSLASVELRSHLFCLSCLQFLKLSSSLCWTQVSSFVYILLSSNKPLSLESIVPLDSNSMSSFLGLKHCAITFSVKYLALNFHFLSRWHQRFDHLCFFLDSLCWT